MDRIKDIRDGYKSLLAHAIQKDDPEVSNGGPAFPHIAEDKKWWQEKYGGMSLRDYFAGQALLGMNSNPDLLEIVTAGDVLDGSVFQRLSSKAYEQADAMLEERNKPAGGD